LAQFERAVTHFPSYYEAYHEMGVAYIRLGQPAEAEKAFRKSIEVSESHYSEAYFALASLLSTNQRFAEAEPLVRQGLELDRNAWEGHYELARALLGLNRVDAAEKSAEEARTRKPDSPPLFLLLANIHIRKHDYPALLQDLDSYLKLEPTGPMSEQARRTREKIQHALGNAQNAPTAGPPKP
jgi:tetratricopeptide (TPR) repeat protein